VRDVWIENGVIWAAAAAGLPVSASRRLTHRAIAMAGQARSSRIVLDFRGASLIGNTLALNWHADMLAKSKPPRDIRIAMLCNQYSESVQLWERMLQERDHQAAVFIDIAAALRWLVAPARTTGIATTDVPVPSPATARSDPTATLSAAEMGSECTDAESLKLLLQRYADGLGAVPHHQVVAEFVELLECLLTNAELLGVDAMRGLQQQLLSQRKRRDQR
jgi:hypothetical protein